MDAESTHVPAPQPALGERVSAALRLRHMSRRTERAYLDWVRRFWLFTNRRDPAMLGPAQVMAFLNDLAVNQRVAAATENQALAALLFLYRHVLGHDLPWLDDLVRAPRSQHLPVVLSRSEVRDVLLHMAGVPRLMALLLYGAGLRLLECCHLRVKDIDCDRNQITVRRGKGAEDRTKMLPAAAKADLAAHLERMRAQPSATSPRVLASSSCPPRSRQSCRTPRAYGPGTQGQGPDARDSVPVSSAGWQGVPVHPDRSRTCAAGDVLAAAA